MNGQIARTPRQVGEALHRRRRALGLTQQDVADKRTLRQATISGLEAGDPGTRLGTLFNVLVALDLELVIRPRTKASPDAIEDLI